MDSEDERANGLGLEADPAHDGGAVPETVSRSAWCASFGAPNARLKAPADKIQ